MVISFLREKKNQEPNFRISLILGFGLSMEIIENMFECLVGMGADNTWKRKRVFVEKGTTQK